MNHKLLKMKTQLEARTKRLLGLTACTLIFLCASVSGAIPVHTGNENTADFISGFQMGLLCALLIVFTYKLMTYRKALTDEKLLKQLYYKENDERECYISQQVGKSSMSITVIVMLILTVIAGYFHEVVFFTMLAATVLQALIQLVLKFYYTNRLSGKETEEAL
ncbi:MAG: hypothetical protein PUJ55_16720 [Clostridiales bacterium]|nr:hypothetical protein [Roseburia sp.]MDD7638563.1 hypothetical protein [Clostridiales bacterium]MDY4111464.1 hypothetical protein [Roseburia sp.]